MSECKHHWGEQDKIIKSPICLLCGEDFINHKAKELQDENADLKRQVEVLSNAIQIAGKNNELIGKENEQLQAQIEHLQFQLGETCLKIAEYEKTPLEDVKAWTDGLRQGYVELQAQCAAMRQALEVTKEIPSLCSAIKCKDKKDHILQNEIRLSEVVRMRKNALSATAGADMLKRVRDLEQAREIAIRELEETIDGNASDEHTICDDCDVLQCVKSVYAALVKDGAE